MLLKCSAMDAAPPRCRPGNPDIAVVVTGTFFGEQVPVPPVTTIISFMQPSDCAS
jgi:hypothetical protein